MAQNSEKIIKEENDQTKDNPEAYDAQEKLIVAAVKFLQNPKVRESPFKQRRAFLQKKGLSAAAIDEAIARSGTIGDVEIENMKKQPPVQSSHQTSYALQPVATSSLVQLRDYLSTAVLIGGIGYAIYKFLQNYLGEPLFGPSEHQRHMKALELSLATLEKSVSQTTKMMCEMQQTISHQKDDFTKLLGQLTKPSIEENERTSEPRFMAEVKDEMKSLKSLLLSRGQFPPPPPVAVSPSIPAWQLCNSAPTPDNSSTPTPEISSSTLADSSCSVMTGSDSMLTNTSTNDMLFNENQASDVDTDTQVNGHCSQTGADEMINDQQSQLA